MKKLVIVLSLAIGVCWLLVLKPVVFVCVFGVGVALANAVYWLSVFAEHTRSAQAGPAATVDGRPVRDVEVMP